MMVLGAFGEPFTEAAEEESCFKIIAVESSGPTGCNIHLTDCQYSCTKSLSQGRICFVTLLVFWMLTEACWSDPTDVEAYFSCSCDVGG